MSAMLAIALAEMVIVGAVVLTVLVDGLRKRNRKKRFLSDTLE